MSDQIAKVRLNFEDGSSIANWQSVSFTEKFTDPLGSMTVMLTPPDYLWSDYSDRTKKGSLVAFEIDGKTQCVMAIQTRRRTAGSSGFSIQLDCVSPITVLYEGAADASLSKVLQSDASVLDLVSEAVKPYGISEIGAEIDIATLKSKTGKGIGGAAVNAKALSYSEAQVQPNETVYQFLARILTRQGVMLRMDLGNGFLYVTAPHYDGEELYTLRQGPNGVGPAGDAFFGDVEEVDSNDGQYSFVEVTGVAVDKDDETFTSTPKARVTSADFHPSRPPFRASQSLAYKPCFIRDTNSRDNKTAQSTCKLKLGLNAESAYSIKGSVAGIVSKTGVPWSIDTLVRTFVDAFDIDEVMWIGERTVSVNSQGGQATSLTVIPKNYVVLGDAP